MVTQRRDLSHRPAPLRRAYIPKPGKPDEMRPLAIPTLLDRAFKVREDKSPFDGDWVYWSARLGREPTKPRRVTRLLKRQRGHCAHCGLRFVAGDVLEVHHHDGNHVNNAFDNLRLLHGHCHDVAHGKGCP